MTAIEFVKILLAKEDITMTELTRLLNLAGDKKFTVDGISHKMRKGTLRFDEDEVELFANTLGYGIELKKMEEDKF